jgi:hypothetical protein
VCRSFFSLFRIHEATKRVKAVLKHHKRRKWRRLKPSRFPHPMTRQVLNCESFHQVGHVFFRIVLLFERLLDGLCVSFQHAHCRGHWRPAPSMDPPQVRFWGAFIVDCIVSFRIRWSSCRFWPGAPFVLRVFSRLSLSVKHRFSSDFRHASLQQANQHPRHYEQAR